MVTIEEIDSHHFPPGQCQGNGCVDHATVDPMHCAACALRVVLRELYKAMGMLEEVVSSMNAHNRAIDSAKELLGDYRPF